MASKLSTFDANTFNEMLLQCVLADDNNNFGLCQAWLNSALRSIDRRNVKSYNEHFPEHFVSFSFH